MKKSTLQSSTSERNRKLRELINKNPDLINEVADAQICNSIAVDLYNLRMQTGITQRELAQKLGVQQSNISRWEQPGYQGYKLKMLSKIARVLGGHLQVAITPPIETLVAFWSYRETEHRRVEIISREGWQISSETMKAKQLFGVRLGGIGAKDATA